MLLNPKTSSELSRLVSAQHTTPGWRVPDAGIPLHMVGDGVFDPLEVWKTQPSVRKVVGFISRNVAMLPWHVFERASDQDRVRVRDSMAERRLRSPRRFRGGFAFWRDIVTDMCLSDRFLIIDLGEDGLLRVPPRLWSVEATPLGVVKHIWVKFGDEKHDVMDAPIACSWGWADSYPGGVSPMKTLAALLDERSRAVAYRTSQWSNAPKFSGIITRPKDAGPWADAKKARFIESFRTWKDTEGAGGVPLLEDGMDYKPIEHSEVKTISNDLEGRRLTDIEVASMFHVPPELVGAREGTFSNVSAFRQMLFGPVLGPIIVELEQAINDGLMSVWDPSGAQYAEINRDAAMSGGFMEQATILQTMTGGPVMTRTEARQRLNLPHLADADELIVPLNVLEGGQASPTDSGQQNRKPGLKSRRVRRAKSLADDLAGFEDDLAGLDPEDLVWDDDTKILARKLRALMVQTTNKHGGRVDDVEAFREAHQGRFAQVLQQFTGKHATAGAWDVLREVNADGDGWNAELMENWLVAQSESMAGSILAGLADVINGAVDGRADDDDRSVFQVLMAAVRDHAALQGETFAEAACIGAENFGARDAARASGMRTKTWIVTSSNPRPSHAAMDGETVPIEDEFSNGGQFPHDWDLDADESAGCTCEVTYA